MTVGVGLDAGDRELAARAWGLACRVAGVSSALGAVSAFALHHFLGVAPALIVAGAATAGLAVGTRLPVPARAAGAPRATTSS